MAAAVDRRRFAGPGASTTPIIFASSAQAPTTAAQRERTRAHNEARKIFLQTNLAPAAASSAYLELTPTNSTSTSSLDKAASATPKLALTLNGPHPLPRSAPFSPTLTLTTYLALAPFARAQRTPHIRTPTERDLTAHLETALRGAVIAERYPKTAAEVAVTALEAEAGDLGLLNVLASAITAGGTALVDAGFECVDVVAGGVAALIERDAGPEVYIDPASAEVDEARIRALCLVGYLAQRDEIVEIWLRGDAGAHYEALVDGAVAAAKAARSVAAEVLTEGVKAGK